MIWLGFTDEIVLFGFIKLQTIFKYYSNYVFEGFIDFQQIMILRFLLYGWENECPSSAQIIAQKIQLTQSTLRWLPIVMIGSIQYDVIHPWFVPEKLSYHSTEEDNVAFDP